MNVRARTPKSMIRIMTSIISNLYDFFVSCFSG